MRRERVDRSRASMTAIYRITELHASHRGGMNAAVDADIRGIAKTNDWSPYTLANEIIAARIGQTLGLPVPAGVIAEDAAKRLYYLSLDVSREQKQLPPVIAADFAREEPWLSAGCVAFDILIANGDRNVTNLSRDPAFNPPRVSIFDHGHSLLGTNPPTGLDRLELARDRLGCRDDSAQIGSNHVLRDQPLDRGHLEAWVERIGALPVYVFEDVCTGLTSTPTLNVDGVTARAVGEWLLQRSRRLGALIGDHQDAFPAVHWGLWELGSQR